MEKQKALLERQKALETVINNSPMIVFLWKAEKSTGLPSMSPRMSDSLDIPRRISFPEEYFMGRLSIQKTFCLWNSSLRRTVRREENQFNRQYRVLTPASEVRWVEEKNTFIQRNEEGGVSYFQGIIEDVTDSLKRSKNPDQPALTTIIIKKRNGINNNFPSTSVNSFYDPAIA